MESPAGSRGRSHTESGVKNSKKQQVFDSKASVELPHYRRRLYELFHFIDKEMEALHMENFQLKARLEDLEEQVANKLGSSSAVGITSRSMPMDDSVQSFHDDLQLDSQSQFYKHYKKKLQARQLKWKTAFRRPSGKLAMLKSSGNVEASKNNLINYYKGHTDIVWDVSTISLNSGRHFIASASADQTAKIYMADDGDNVFANYSGHSGSVNSISLHPDSAQNQKITALTTSGDKTAHIFSVQIDETMKINVAEKNRNDKDQVYTQQIQQPLIRLSGHSDVVCDGKWLMDGDQIITASWDRSSNIFDVENGKVIKALTGHDDRLLCCSAHSSQKLVATSSKDCTFRLWDFREAIQSVAVFQGHNDGVTSCVFSSQHHIISGSDDRTVKVWDLRNMRSPIVALRLDSSVNKIAISPTNLVAIPLDNRQILVYNLNGTRFTRISRVAGKGHEKMVSCSAWLNGHSNMNLVTCSVDCSVIGWNIQIPSSVAS